MRKSRAMEMVPDLGADPGGEGPRAREGGGGEGMPHSSVLSLAPA